MNLTRYSIERQVSADAAHGRVAFSANRCTRWGLIAAVQYEASSLEGELNE